MLKNKGFTIIEVVVTIAIFGLLMSAVAWLAVVVLLGPKQQQQAKENIDQARIVAQRFVNEIRSAATGNDGSFAITQAGNSEIIFYTNSGATAQAVNKVRYFISGTDLKRGVIVPTGDPLSYSGPERISIVQNNLANGAEPLFYYYNGDYDGSGSPLLQPVNLNQIKFIKINLIVKKQTTTTDENFFTTSAGAAIRNLKDNLGD